MGYSKTRALPAGISENENGSNFPGDYIPLTGRLSLAIIRIIKLARGEKVKNILDEIVRLRMERNWSEYMLAKNCGLSQSTIGTWYRSNQTPTIRTLEKVCRGLGITLSQFFAEADDAVSLTKDQQEMLDAWCALPPKKRRLVVELLKNS